MADQDFERVWNAWHLELCSTADLASEVFGQLIDRGDVLPAWIVAAAAICRDRLQVQAESAPVPPFKLLRGGDS